MLGFGPGEGGKGMGQEKAVEGDRRGEHSLFCQPRWVTAVEKPAELTLEQ